MHPLPQAVPRPLYGSGRRPVSGRVQEFQGHRCFVKTLLHFCHLHLYCVLWPLPAFLLLPAWAGQPAQQLFANGLAGNENNKELKVLTKHLCSRWCWAAAASNAQDTAPMTTRTRQSTMMAGKCIGFAPRVRRSKVVSAPSRPPLPGSNTPRAPPQERIGRSVLGGQ